MDPFDDFRMSNPFSMLREFERIFEDDLDFHKTDEGSFLNTGRDDVDFFKGFFGIDDEFDERGRGRFNGDRFPPGRMNGYNANINQPRFYNPNHPGNSGQFNENIPNKHLNQTPPQASEPEPEPVVDTAASRANAKVYDV